MKIACASLVFDLQGKIIALSSTKGKGITLPGGKWEEGETFVEAALRELQEETGLIGKSAEYLFGGFSQPNVWCYTFKVKVTDFSTIKSSREGEVVLATWHDLLRSQYKPYYELVRGVYDGIA